MLGILVAITAVLAFGPSLALAQDRARPAFSRDEQAIVDRNAVLSELASKNPRLVRKALEALRTPETGTAKSLSVQKPRPSRRVAADELQMDPGANPDLERLLRSSPEAAHDLFQLLKKAGRTQKEQRR